MILKLTLKQKIEYYSIVGFLLLLPIILFILNLREHNGNSQVKEIIMISIPFFLLSSIIFWISKRRLRFSEIDISVTDDEFNQAITKSIEQLEWVIEEQNNNYVRASRLPDLLGSEMITIYRNENKIYINCIANPEYRASLLTFGLRKTHIKTFREILLKTKAGIPFVQAPDKWTLGDYLLRVFGYPICLLFIGLAIFLLIPNGYYGMGILIGLIGSVILIMDLKRIIKKKSSR